MDIRLGEAEVPLEFDLIACQKDAPDFEKETHSP